MLDEMLCCKCGNELSVVVSFRLNDEIVGISFCLYHIAEAHKIIDSIRLGTIQEIIK